MRRRIGGLLLVGTVLALLVAAAMLPGSLKTSAATCGYGYGYGYGCDPQLTLTKTLDGQLIAGQNAMYTLTVSNVGNGPTTGTIVVTDTLPSQESYVAAGGNGWSCSNSGQNVTCTNPGPINPGHSSSFNLTVLVAANATGQIINVATVFGGGTLGSSTGQSVGSVQAANVNLPSAGREVAQAAPVAPAIGGSVQVPGADHTAPSQQGPGAVLPIVLIALLLAAGGLLLVRAPAPAKG